MSCWAVIPSSMLACVTAARGPSPLANVAPRLVADIYDKYVAGDIKGLLESRVHVVAPLRIAFNLGTFPAVIKESLELLGIDAGALHGAGGSDERR